MRLPFWLITFFKKQLSCQNCFYFLFFIFFLDYTFLHNFIILNLFKDFIFFFYYINLFYLKCYNIICDLILFCNNSYVLYWNFYNYFCLLIENLKIILIFSFIFLITCEIWKFLIPLILKSFYSYLKYVKICNFFYFFFIILIFFFCFTFSYNLDSYYLSYHTYNIISHYKVYFYHHTLFFTLEFFKKFLILIIFLFITNITIKLLIISFSFLKLFWKNCLNSDLTLNFKNTITNLTHYPNKLKIRILHLIIIFTTTIKELYLSIFTKLKFFFYQYHHFFIILVTLKQPFINPTKLTTECWNGKDLFKIKDEEGEFLNLFELFSENESLGSIDELNNFLNNHIPTTDAGIDTTYISSILNSLINENERISEMHYNELQSVVRQLNENSESIEILSTTLPSSIDSIGIENTLLEERFDFLINELNHVTDAREDLEYMQLALDNATRLLEHSHESFIRLFPDFAIDFASNPFVTITGAFFLLFFTSYYFFFKENKKKYTNEKIKEMKKKEQNEKNNKIEELKKINKNSLNSQRNESYLNAQLNQNREHRKEVNSRRKMQAKEIFNNSEFQWMAEAFGGFLLTMFNKLKKQMKELINIILETLKKGFKNVIDKFKSSLFWVMVFGALGFIIKNFKERYNNLKDKIFNSMREFIKEITKNHEQIGDKLDEILKLIKENSEKREKANEELLIQVKKEFKNKFSLGSSSKKQNTTSPFEQILLGNLYPRYALTEEEQQFIEFRSRYLNDIKQRLENREQNQDALLPEKTSEKNSEETSEEQLTRLEQETTEDLENRLNYKMTSPQKVRFEKWKFQTLRVYRNKKKNQRPLILQQQSNLAQHSVSEPASPMRSNRQLFQVTPNNFIHQRQQLTVLQQMQEVQRNLNRLSNHNQIARRMVRGLARFLRRNR